MDYNSAYNKGILIHILAFDTETGILIQAFDTGSGILIQNQALATDTGSCYRFRPSDTKSGFLIYMRAF